MKSLVSTLVLHMDDNNPQIQVCICSVMKIKFHLSSIFLIVISINLWRQELVYEALQVCTALRPVIVEEIITNSCDRHQTKAYFDNLLAKAMQIKERQDQEVVTVVNSL